MHIIFTLVESPVILPELKRLFLQLYPVAPLRRQVIKEYFFKTAHGRFPHNHPLKGMNFQFLMNPKTITKMLVQGEIQPLTCNTKIMSIEGLSGFHKYYEDLMRLAAKKESKMYMEEHMKRVKICDMLHYRIYTPIFRQTVINSEDLYLKTIAEYTEKVTSDQEVISKHLKDVFHFIKTFNQLTYSLAH